MATISTMLRLIDNVSNPLKSINNSLGQTGKGFESFAGKIVSVNSAIQLLSSASRMLQRGIGMVNQYVGAYQLQIENETKLTTVMRQRMNATDEQINSIKELAKLEQQRGIYGDEMILQGAQELATYVNDKQALEQLIPAMGHLLAQQKGVSAGFQDMQSVATMMGKVMGGQIGGLSRIGYVFSEDEKKMLQYGTEAERASVLAKIITDNVSEMNYALAGTNAGSIVNTKNALKDFREEIGKILEPIMSVFNKLKSAIVEKFREPILQTLQMIVDNMPVILESLMNLALVVASVGTVMFVAWSLAHLPLLIMIGAVVAFIDLMNQAGEQTGSIGAFIGGVFGGIKATVQIVYGWIHSLVSWLFEVIPQVINQIKEAINITGDDFNSLGETIGKIMGGVGAVIWNTMVLIYNIGVDIANNLLTLIEFFINVWKHPLRSLGSLFVGLAEGILGILSNVSSVIDFIFGTSIAENLQNAKENLEKFRKENLETDDMTKLGRYEYAQFKDFNQAVYEGGQKGKVVQDWLVSNVIDPIRLGVIEGAETGADYEQWMRKTLGDIAFNTGVLPQAYNPGTGSFDTSEQNEIKLDDDWKSLLTEQATRQYQLSYATITPDFSIQNVNVSSEADVDSIFDRIADKIAELSQTYIKKG